MSSDQVDVVFADGDLDDEDDPSSSDNELDVLNVNDEEDEELEEEESEDINPRPIAAAPVTTLSSDYTVVPLALPAVTVASTPSVPDPKRQRVGDGKKPLAQIDESRRLFQRLWTDEDEIELLQGFLEYTTQRGNSNSHHHHDTALFYDQIKSKLQLDFNKNQLVEKLRRLKKKYRNVMSKISSGKDFSFKSHHDQATFEISRKIWSSSGVGKGNVDSVLDDEDGNGHNVNLIDDGVEKKTPNSRKRSRSKPAVTMDEKRVSGEGIFANNTSNNGNVEKISGGCLTGSKVAGLIEETLRSCLPPMFKELLSSAIGGGAYGAKGLCGLAMNAMPLNFVGLGSGSGSGSGSGGDVVDERWRKQQILELEVYSKRLELVQDQIKAALEQLRSAGR